MNYRPAYARTEPLATAWAKSRRSAVARSARVLAERRMTQAKQSFTRAITTGDPLLIDAAIAAVNRAMADLGEAKK